MLIDFESTHIGLTATLALNHRPIPGDYIALRDLQGAEVWHVVSRVIIGVTTRSGANMRVIAEPSAGPPPAPAPQMSTVLGVPVTQM